MQYPPAFRRLMHGFHVDVLDGLTTNNEIADHVLQFIEKSQVAELQIFLRDLLNPALSDQQFLRALNRASPNLEFDNAVTMRDVLLVIQERMLTHPMLR